MENGSPAYFYFHLTPKSSLGYSLGEFLETHTADVAVRPPDVAQTLLLLSTAASEPMGSYAQMGWYGVESPYKP